MSLKIQTKVKLIDWYVLNQFWESSDIINYFENGYEKLNHNLQIKVLSQIWFLFVSDWLSPPYAKPENYYGYKNKIGNYSKYSSSLRAQ